VGCFSGEDERLGVWPGRVRRADAALSKSTRRSFKRREIASRCLGCVRRERRWSVFARDGRRGVCLSVRSGEGGDVTDI